MRFWKNILFSVIPLHILTPARPKITARNQKNWKLTAFWVCFYLISWKLKKFKIVEKSVKTENLYTYSDQRGILFETQNPPNVAYLIVMFFVQKNDERENCQQRKVLTSHPIEICEFQKMSLPKITKNREKSDG